jgi:RNA polymerase sigma factor (sigma-70 family)
MEEKQVKEIYSILNKNAFVLKLSDDDIQDLVIMIIEKFDLFNKDKATLNTWIYNIAKNYKINEYRKEESKRKDVIKIIEIGSYYNEMIQSDDSNHQQLQKLQQAIKQTLDEREKDILFLFYNGNKFEDICNELNINLSSAKTIAQRAKQKIKLFFDKNPN